MKAKDVIEAMAAWMLAKAEEERERQRPQLYWGATYIQAVEDREADLELKFQQCIAQEVAKQFREVSQ